MLNRPILRPLAAMTLLLSGAVQGVTLGDARVKSFLNQPLNAEIELVGLAPGQHLDLRLRIANDDQFERLGIEYNHFLQSFRFDVVESDGQWVVRVRSQRAVTEPFLDFPLQLNWLGGQFVRQYTLLIDPQRPVRPATTARTRPATPPATRPATPTPKPVAAARSPFDGENYGPVRRGETLWPIAQRVKPAGITTQQMAVALLRTNPQAFINGDINKLKAGAMLSIPPLVVIEELDARTANREFLALANGRPSTIASSPRQTRVPLQATEEPAEATPPPLATVEPDERAPEQQPQLRILNKDPKPSESESSGDSASLQEQLLIQLERIETNRIANSEVKSRLDKLEQELSRMQRLIDLKNEQIAALESELTAQEDADPQKPAPVPAKPVDEVGDPTRGEATTAPTELVKVDPVPTPKPVDETEPAGDTRPFYEQYLWLIWAALGLLGVTALGVLLKHRKDDAEEQAVELPQVTEPAAAAVAVVGGTDVAVPLEEELERAEKDFQELEERELAPVAETTEEPQELPQLDIGEVTQIESEMNEGLANTLLDEMIEKQEALDRQRETAAGTTEFSDEDIASWVQELSDDTETDEHGSEEAEVSLTTVDLPDPPELDTSPDVPEIIDNLDQQLVSGEVSELQLDEVEEADEALVEDDAFSMSLDLARAYLEIGDQDGAKDMLKQALSGARDPDHRRQIEDLLAQIN